VLTYGTALAAQFGSGECGQCAHGDESEADLVVTVPRVVYSLRNKNICQVACGGLHNAAVTTEGRVITWGCNDDKALGRDGDEKVPMVIESLRWGMRIRAHTHTHIHTYRHTYIPTNNYICIPQSHVMCMPAQRCLAPHTPTPRSLA
jgi:alpha-tubulin suppressor-like RCC1 family protein